MVEADGDAAHTTRMRLAAAQALGQLVHALAASDAAANPARPQLEALLRGSTATGRMLAACVVSFWAQLQPGASGSGAAAAQPAAADPCLQQLLGSLLELLALPAAAAASYAELAQLYAQLRSQASGLIARALQGDVVLSMPGPLDSLGHQGALALAAQVPATAGESLVLRRPQVGPWCLPAAAAAANSTATPLLPCSSRRPRAAAGAGRAEHNREPAADERGGTPHHSQLHCGCGGRASGQPAPQAQHNHSAAGGSHPPGAAGAAAGRGGRGARMPGAAVRRPHALSQRQVSSGWPWVGDGEQAVALLWDHSIHTSVETQQPLSACRVCPQDHQKHVRLCVWRPTRSAQCGVPARPAGRAGRRRRQQLKRRAWGQGCGAHAAGAAGGAGGTGAGAGTAGWRGGAAELDTAGWPAAAAAPAQALGAGVRAAGRVAAAGCHGRPAGGGACPACAGGAGACRAPRPCAAA